MEWQFVMKVIGICDGYVEDKWVIRSVLLFLSVNINLSSMYLKKNKEVSGVVV